MTDPCIEDLRALLPTLERLGQRRRVPRGAVLIEQGRHDRQMERPNQGRQKRDPRQMSGRYRLAVKGVRVP